MKRILFSLGLFLALVGSHAYAEIFYAEPVNGTYSDCTKAIEKGVAILVDPEATIFYYKDRLYTIIPTPSTMECRITKFQK